MDIKHLSDLFLFVKERPIRRMVIANGIDAHSIEAAELAREQGIVKVSITGDSEKIGITCAQLGIKAENFQIVATDTEEEAVARAVTMIHDKEADFIMKGLINTDKYMRAILNKELGIVSPHQLLSHVSIIDNPVYHKLLFVSDVAIIPFPSLKQKVTMTNYLIEVATRMGIANPKVALIAPTEQILEGIPACVDAAKIKQLFLAGEITGGVVDGPMALDVAIDRESADIKKIKSDVAGNADCLLFPNIDAGNVFYKTNAKLCHSEQAAIVYGAKVPVVLSSRGDSAQTKLNSIVLAAIMS